MKVTSHSQLLPSLTTLINPNARDQQVQQRQPITEKNAETARQERIAANREALNKFQARLKAEALARLKAKELAESADNRTVNLNLRENFSNPARDNRPGQLIDITV